MQKKSRNNLSMAGDTMVETNGDTLQKIGTITIHILDSLTEPSKPSVGELIVEAK